MTSFNNEEMARAFFGDIASVAPKTKILCKGGCNKQIQKPKSGYTSFTSHIESYHKETMMEVYHSFKQARVVDNIRGPMDEFNPKRFASSFAKRVQYLLSAHHFFNPTLRFSAG